MISTANHRRATRASSSSPVTHTERGASENQEESPFSNPALHSLSSANDDTLPNIFRELTARAQGKRGSGAPQLLAVREDLLALSFANRAIEAVTSGSDIVPHVKQCLVSNRLASHTKSHLLIGLGRYAAALFNGSTDSQDQITSIIQTISRFIKDKDTYLAKSAMNSILEITEKMRGAWPQEALKKPWADIRAVAKTGFISSLISQVAVPKAGSITDYARDILAKRAALHFPHARQH